MLYSSAIVDASASLALPDAGSRYRTAIVVDPDRYIEHVFDRPGFRLTEPGLRQGRRVSGC
jgi:hypothetical protein